MPIENADFISELVPSNPVGNTDLRSTSDDHHRLIKQVLLNTIPFDELITLTAAEINALYGPHNPPPEVTVTTPVPTVQLFTADGTWTKPANCKYIVVEVQGGGGGGCPDVGGSNGNSGAGGGYARKTIDVTSIANASIKVAGAAAVGVNGADSSYDDTTNLVAGQGGQAGQVASSTNYDAVPGDGVGGDINIRGGYGKARAGGDSFTGYGGGVNGGGANVAGHNGYSGGGGGGATDDSGGTGGSGFVKITEYYEVGS